MGKEQNETPALLNSGRSALCPQRKLGHEGGSHVPEPSPAPSHARCKRTNAPSPHRAKSVRGVTADKAQRASRLEDGERQARRKEKACFYEFEKKLKRPRRPRETPCSRAGSDDEELGGGYIVPWQESCFAGFFCFLGFFCFFNKLN